MAWYNTDCQLQNFLSQTLEYKEKEHSHALIRMILFCVICQILLSTMILLAPNKVFHISLSSNALNVKLNRYPNVQFQCTHCDQIFPLLCHYAKQCCSAFKTWWYHWSTYVAVLIKYYCCSNKNYLVEMVLWSKTTRAN